MKSLFTFILAIISLSTVYAQNNYWQDFDETRISLSNPESEIIDYALQYRTLSLEHAEIMSALSEAPMEFTSAAASSSVIIELPLPNGKMETIEAVESPVMAPALQAKYPSIRSYIIRSTTNPMITGRLSYSPYGFDATIATEEGHVYISPYATHQTSFYVSYYQKDSKVHDTDFLRLGHYHEIEEELDPLLLQNEVMSLQTDLSFRNNEEVPIRQYRLALVCTGEYGEDKGGTVEAVLATYNTALNLVNQIFQVETSTRLQLIPESEDFIHLDSDEDPFLNGNEGAGLLEQNTNYLNGQIPISSYDIGHIFTGPCTDVGGVASLSSLCTPFRARGATCHYTNINEIVNSVMAHEVGHQFSAGHTFNNCPDSEDQISLENAFEPGSGSTIMAYQGLCGAANNIPAPVGMYYHVGSLEDWVFFTREGGGFGEGCGETINSGNNQPEITIPYEDGFFIPISTPFELEASAEDVDGDPITYCWEQYDIGPNTTLGSPVLNSPIFRSFPPTETSIRVFPRLDKIIANSFDNTEILPTYDRDLTFRCTARDNVPEAGGAVWGQVAFRADETAGPFRVTYPNSNGVTWEVGDYQEVTWDVANTTNNKVNCNYVNILLSIDGGFTYPYTLVTNTPNDGAAFVSVPDAITNDARIRIEASSNIFFDLSNQDFEIAPAAAPGFALDVTPASIPLYCLPDDPLNFEVNTASLLDYDMPISLSVNGSLPGDASASFSQDMINPGESATLTIDMGSFSGRDTFNLQVEGTTDDLGTLSRELRFIAVSTDFTGLELLTPENGTSGVFLTTDFSWSSISGADSYDIEIADGPAFGDRVVESAQGLTETTYTPEILFEDDELYYWRVRPVNECGAGEYLTAYGFHTSSIDCAGFTASDIPIGLPPNPNTKISTIFVPEGGTISDLNLENVVISFNPVNSIRITLAHVESGTEVVVYDQECLNTNIISLSFDDEAPTDIICPPFSNNPVRPINPLSAFDGQDSQGEWQLKVQVVTSGFGSGTISGWGLDFCSTVVVEPPLLVTNAPFPIPSGETSTITTDFLDATDNVASPSQIKFTLVEVPKNGSLFRTSDPEPLMPGESFTQQTINSWNLSYQHDGSATTEDQFVFVVENNQGGWIPNQTFEIIIDEGATVNTKDLAINNDLSLFPNPAKDNVQLLLQTPLAGQAIVRVINTQGQVLSQTTMVSGMKQKDLDTSRLPAGMYLIELQTANNQLSQKLVIQR